MPGRRCVPLAHPPRRFSIEPATYRSFPFIRSDPMARIVLCLAALTSLALPCRADEASATTETLIRLSVDAVSAPKPALRYQLLPEFNEMNRGNPIQNYLKCFMERHQFFFDKEAVTRRENLSSMPLEELPAGELQDYGG